MKQKGKIRIIFMDDRELEYTGEYQIAERFVNLYIKEEYNPNATIRKYPLVNIRCVERIVPKTYL